MGIRDWGLGLALLALAAPLAAQQYTFEEVASGLKHQDAATRLRAIEILKDADHAEAATPIGVTCRLCHRTECTARSAPPIGRQILPDDIRRTSAPFGFSDS